MTGQLAFGVWGIVAAAIWTWALWNCDTSAGDGDAVFVAIVCGAGLVWPIVLAVLVIAFLIYRWRRSRRPERSWS
ncbi:MAG TPA: hypothetical protein VEC11_07770 [Allosphingosinicella sp.]|nr:hypothetical protein [Allosphingosinicella sp.]